MVKTIDFDRLHAFVRELAHHLHHHRLEPVAPKGTIRWEDYDEFLAQAETEFDALLRYLEMHGEVDTGRLPEWNEFQEVAADYEVPLPQ